MIFHLTKADDWLQAQKIGEYRASSLDNEGFIHASTLGQVIPVANAFYRFESSLILLCLDRDRIFAEIKWEAPVHPRLGDVDESLEREVFPHIYGAINLEAVRFAIALSPDENGYFSLPAEISN